MSFIKDYLRLLVQEELSIGAVKNVSVPVKKSLKEVMFESSPQEAFERYALLKKSNLPLFNATARRAKLIVKAYQTKKSIEETIKLFKMIMDKFETPAEEELEVVAKPKHQDVLKFIEAALTKKDDRREAKNLYIQVIKALK